MDRMYQTDVSNEHVTAPTLTPGRDDLRERFEQLEHREQQMVELLGCEKPERIVHDLRNLLNELQLLKLLTQGGH